MQGIKQKHHISKDFITHLVKNFKTNFHVLFMIANLIPPLRFHVAHLASWYGLSVSSIIGNYLFIRNLIGPVREDQHYPQKTQFLLHGEGARSKPDILFFDTAGD